MRLRILLGTWILGGALATAAHARADAPAPQEGTTNAQLSVDSQRAAAARWYKLGRERLKEGSYDAARDCLEAAIQLDPQLVGAYKGLAKAWQGLKQPERELETLELGIENNPVPPGTDSSGLLLQTDSRLWLYMDLAGSLRRQGQRERATRTLQTCLQQDPGFWCAARLLAVHLDEGRDLQGADRVIDSAFERLCSPASGPGSSTRRTRAVQAVRKLYEELGRPTAIQRLLR